MTDIEIAYEQYKNSPMPKLNQNHIFDRPKHELENEAIRNQIKRIAELNSVSFKELDDYIESESKKL